MKWMRQSDVRPMYPQSESGACRDVEGPRRRSRVRWRGLETNVGRLRLSHQRLAGTLRILTGLGCFFLKQPASKRTM
jgi:hypothetical protein